MIVETNEDPDKEIYYDDHEMPEMIATWVDQAFEDRDDHPVRTFMEATLQSPADAGVVDGIRPHRLMTEAEMELQRRAYENMPVDTGEINIIRGTG